MSILKPSRFGKSLFMSTVANFLDLRNKDNFHSLFGGLKAEELAKGKLKEHVTSYHVLRFNFSLNVSLTMSVETVEKKFEENINSQIIEFCSDYKLEPQALDIDMRNDFTVNMRRIANYILNHDKCPNLFVLIDEYDRFANKLLLDPFDDNSATTFKLWNKIAKGQSEIPGYSPMRSFFETLKEIGSRPLKNYQSLTTGILPIAMADASGWNICGDVSEDPGFGDVFGFKREHLLKALRDIGISDDKEVGKILFFMRTHFNGHRFSKSSENLYNPQLCLWFLKNLLSDKEFKQQVLELENVRDTSSFPSLLKEGYIDNNLKQSTTFLKLLSHYPMTTQIVKQLLACRSIQQEPSQASLPLDSSSPITLASSLVKEEGQEKTVWGVDIDVVMNTGIKTDKFLETVTVQEEIQRILSLMYFYGLVTRTEPNKAILCIPNRVVFDQLFKYFMARNHVQVDAVKEFLSQPSDYNLEIVLRTVVESLETKMDNTYSEEALQSAIEASLRQMELLGVVEFKVYCNSPFKNASKYNADGEQDFRFDLALETNHSLFFIELKRLRPNAVKVFGKEGEPPIGFTEMDGTIQTQVYWKQSELAQQQANLDNMQHTNILGLRTHFPIPNTQIRMARDKNGRYINKSDQTLCVTVKDVLQYATNQGIFYAGLVKRDGGNISPKETDLTTEQLKQRMKKPVHIFGVVNISRSTFVVQGHPNNGQRLDQF